MTEGSSWYMLMARYKCITKHMRQRIPPCQQGTFQAGSGGFPRMGTVHMRWNGTPTTSPNVPHQQRYRNLLADHVHLVVCLHHCTGDLYLLQDNALHIAAILWLIGSVNTPQARGWLPDHQGHWTLILFSTSAMLSRLVYAPCSDQSPWIMGAMQWSWISMAL